MQYINHYESPLEESFWRRTRPALPVCGLRDRNISPVRCRRNRRKRKRRFLNRQSAGWIFTFPEKSRIFPYLCICLEPISRKRYGRSSAPSLTGIHDLRGDRQAAGCRKGIVPYVGPGGRRRGRPQSHLDPGALSPGSGSLRQSHWLRRGPGQKSKITDSGEGGYAEAFYSQKGNSLMKPEGKIL